MSELTGKRLAVMCGILAVATVVVAGVCSLVGQYGLDELTPEVWRMRVFRLIAACAVGAGLAVSGMALQALLRNPLAEPYILGISSGAGVGVLLGGALAGVAAIPEWATTPVLAMVGALVTACVVYGVAQFRGRLDPFVLLLSGVIVNVFNGALILVILQFVKQADMIHFIGWGMGKIPDWFWFKPKLLVLCCVLVLLGWAVLFVRSRAFNMLGLGDEVASSSGIAVGWLRVETFIVVAVLTSAAVALSGPVGFVGLIIPHICRMVLGPDHRRLVVVCGFAGACFLMVADTLCRMVGELFKMGDLPVGVLTAVMGGPFFIFILRRRLREVI